MFRMRMIDMGDLSCRRFRWNPKTETASLNEEAMLFDPEQSLFFHLNVTASFLWGQLAEPRTAEQLASAVCNSFDGAGVSEDVLRDVQAMLQQMLAHGLIVALE
jgi:hypothetical protein